MSRKVPEEQYKKTRSYHLRQWLDGTKDPFLDTVEMKPQQEFKEDTTVTRQRSEEKKKIYERVFDVEHNAEMRLFQKIYRLLIVQRIVLYRSGARSAHRSLLSADIWSCGKSGEQ